MGDNIIEEHRTPRKNLSKDRPIPKRPNMPPSYIEHTFQDKLKLRRQMNGGEPNIPIRKGRNIIRIKIPPPENLTKNKLSQLTLKQYMDENAYMAV